MAIDFGGTSEAVNMADQAVLDHNAASAAWSFSAWVNSQAAHTDTDLFGKLLSTAPFQGWSMAERTGGNIAAYFIENWSTLAFERKTVATSLLATGWHHVVITSDGSNDADNVAIWVDGVSESCTSVVNNAITGTTETTAAFNLANRDNSSSGWAGYLEDVRVYNRKLTDQEIVTMHTCRGVDCIVSGLVGHWPLNELSPGTAVPSGSGSVKDVSASANNGTQTANPDYVAGVLRI